MGARDSPSSSLNGKERPLSLDEYKRYGRQMIMPDFGLPGEYYIPPALSSFHLPVLGHRGRLANPS